MFTNGAHALEAAAIDIRSWQRTVVYYGGRDCSDWADCGKPSAEDTVGCIDSPQRLVVRTNIVNVQLDVQDHPASFVRTGSFS